MSVIRNLLLFAAVGVPIGAIVGTTTTGGTTAPLATRKVFVVRSATPFTSPTQIAVPQPAPTGTQQGSGSGGVVFNDLGIICTAPYASDAAAAIDLANQVINYRTSIGKTVVEDPALDALAGVDILAIVPAAVPSTTRGGKTVIQRVKAALPKTKSAAEIVVKGCFGINDAQTIMTLILANPPNPGTVAIMNNPNWTSFGVDVRTDLLYGGIIWVIIFAQ